MRKWAPLVLLCFACATLRQPGGSLRDEPIPGSQAIAEPEVELWLENGDAIPPAQANAAAVQARAVLARALATRTVRHDALGAGDALLVVRERAVSRTDARRRAQTWAKVGMVVGVVVVVAVVIVLATKGGNHSSGASSSKSAPSTASSAPAPVAHAAAPSGGPRAGPVLPPPAPHLASSAHGPIWAPVPREPSPGFWLGFNFYSEPQPLVLADEPDAFGRPSPPAPQDETAAAEAAPEPPPPPLALPPAAEFPLDERGFFSGDELQLQADLLDRGTGRVLWSGVLRRDGDARELEDVSAVLDELLAAQGWTQRANAP